ncbi:MAG: DUF1285 domain-containing protein [candidate division NC10 bacterium]|nr:DUF1285 domain-containing protein [candidate division NC10 bacterium]
MREYSYRIDREGRILHDGTEIIDPPTLRFFLLAMTRTPDGRYLATCQGERNWFEPEDTPFVVQRVRPELKDGRLRQVILVFAGEHQEVLDPETLESEDGMLYCQVRQGVFRARFGRLALQQIAPFLVESERGPALELSDGRHPIRPAGADDPPR